MHAASDQIISHPSRIMSDQADQRNNPEAQTGSGEHVENSAPPRSKCASTYSQEFVELHNKKLKITGLCIIAVSYVIYFIFALIYSISKNIGLIVLTVLVVLFIIYLVLKEHINRVVTSCWGRVSQRVRTIGRIVLWIACGIGLVVVVIIQAIDYPYRLVSAVGIVGFAIITFVFSVKPSEAQWRVLFGGLVLQFIMGLLVTRWSYGLVAFEWLGDQLTTFLGHSDAGSMFVLGPDVFMHEFAMLALTAIIFFGAFIEVLYYLGIVQWAIVRFGMLMDVVMSIGPAEAFVAAANVLLGPNASVLTVAPLIGMMTLSELHSVMTSGFSTVAGSLFGAYISFGVPPSDLITASFMSAPAALAVARMFYPPTPGSKLDKVGKLSFPKSTASNAFHALRVGAGEGASLVVHVMANLIAFVAFLTFLNASLAWFGERVGFERFGLGHLTVELILSYLFIPLPYLMGVETWADCFQVSRLLGTKIFLTDIVGYIELGQLINNRKAGLTPSISRRSELIATFALCGFGSLPDIAICLGAIGAIVPSRKSDLSRVALRAMIAGNLACYITACIAGILYDEE